MSSSENYDEYKAYDLKEMCKQRGITGYSKLRKDDLVNLLKDHDEKKNVKLIYPNKISTDLTNQYNLNIYQKYSDLLKAKSDINDNYNLSKIFELYSCIKLNESKTYPFYMYDDIDCDFKEQNGMTKNDTGIDASNLIDTHVQMKAYENIINWKNISTFKGSLNVQDIHGNKKEWKGLLCTYETTELNNNAKILCNGYINQLRFVKKDMQDYCEKLIKNKPSFIEQKIHQINNREYQQEIKTLLLEKGNAAVCVPTGTGKTYSCISIIDPSKKYLIIVPTITLMEQWKEELEKHNINSTQCIGDGNITFKKDICSTICIYNSIFHIPNKYFKTFEKIVVDEAHHIYNPRIYADEDDNQNTDDEDEKEDNDDKKYTDFIRTLKKYNNNILLSATIDEVPDFKYYKKDIRYMIQNKYICDYSINIPVFSKDPNDYQKCKYLIEKYREMIVFCNTQKEGKRIQKMFNSIQNKSAEYIDSNTSKSIRKKILNEFKNGEIPFLINVEVLVEGFDAPNTKGVVLFHIPSSSIKAVQIIGRALRNHPSKNMVQIVLPIAFEENEKGIERFVRILANNDQRIKQSLIKKTFGGYININSVRNDKYNNNDDDDEKDEESLDISDLEAITEIIYDSFGNCLNNIWEEKLNKVEAFIDKEKKRPSRGSKNEEEKKLGQWISDQLKNYKNNKHGMTDKERRKIWEEFVNNDKYKEYLLSYEEEWNINLDRVEAFIDKEKKRPSQTSKNEEEKKLGLWICNQTQNYKNNKQGIVDKERRKIWEEFINNDKYKEYFLSYEEEWNINLDRSIAYIYKEKKRPSSKSKNEEEKKLGKWIDHQTHDYKNNKHGMKDKERRKIWEEFINNDKYKEYFLSNEEEWNINLDRVKTYIDKEKKRPSSKSKNEEEKKLGKWICTQTQDYKNNKKSMKDKERRKIWEEFCQRYVKYF
jgi:superfamily II DNA or RNA helicase